MHARASAWFAAHGLFDEAIVHAVKAKDVLRAATLVEEHVHPSLDREDWRQVERWIGLLPAEVLNRPRLLVAQAWLHYIRYQFPAIVTLLDAAESAMANEPASLQATETTLRGEISALRAAIAYNQSDVQSIVRLAEAAMQQLRPEMQYAMGQANFFYMRPCRRPVSTPRRWSLRTDNSRQPMGGRLTLWPCASCWRCPASTTRWRNCLHCRLSPRRSSSWRTKQGRA